MTSSPPLRRQAFRLSLKHQASSPTLKHQASKLTLKYQVRLTTYDINLEDLTGLIYLFDRSS